MATELDLDKVCVICLQETDDMVSIHDRDDLDLTISEKISKCHPNFNLDELSHRPDKICGICLEDLAGAYRFQSNLETAILLYRSTLGDVKTELNVALTSSSTNKKSQVVTVDLVEEDERHEDDDSGTIRVDELHGTDNDAYDEFCELEELEYEEEHLKDELDKDACENAEETNLEVELRTSPTSEFHGKDDKAEKKRINSRAPKMFNAKPLKQPKEKAMHGPKICDLCGNSYKFKHALVAHMRRHNNVRPYNCECCEKAFVSNVELRRHMRVHTGDKPYSCNYCDRRFSDYGSRIKHERTHTGERPFVCRTCNKSFAYAHVLSVHLRTHTGEKKFQCSQCGKGFTKKAYMLAHMEQHARSALIAVKEEEESQNVYIPYQTVQDNSNESLQECLTTYIVEEIDGETCDLKVLQQVDTSQGNEFILGID